MTDKIYWLLSVCTLNSARCICLPLASLDILSLQAKLTEIGRDEI
jgi:hypothetical protein